MGRVVGYGVSQVPTNGMLGGMAYQDPINVTVNNISVGSGTLTGTASQPLQVTGGAYVSGSFGIGTTNPVAKLDVSGGGISCSGWSNNNSGTAGGLELGWDGTQVVLQSYDRVNNVYKPTIYNASRHSFFIGNVGIGVITPDVRLHINGANAYPATSGTTPTGFIALRNTAGATHGAYIGVANAAPWGTWIQAQDKNNLGTSYPILLNPNGGNVGIGTINPTQRLHVEGNIKCTDTVVIESTPSQASAQFQTNTRFISYQNVQGYNQTSWYYLQVGSGSDSRAGSIRLRVNWTTRHASGVGYHESHIVWRNRHDNSKCEVMEFGRLRENYWGGSYYGWTSAPTVYVYNSDYTGTSAGIWIRIDGHMSFNSGSYDGGVIQHAFIELYANNWVTTPTFVWNSNSTPGLVGSQITPTQL